MPDISFESAKVQSEEIAKNLTSASASMQNAQSAMNNMEIAAGAIANHFNTMAEKSFISEDDLDFSKHLEKITESLGDSYKDAATFASMLLKDLKSILMVEIQRKAVLREMTMQEVKSAAGIKKIGADTTGQKQKQSKLVEKIANKMQDWGKQLKSVALHTAGIQWSFGGILLALLSAWNEMRKVSGLSREIAGQLGGSVEAINAANSAIWDLRGRFRLTFDEAAALVGEVVDLGGTMEDISAGDHFKKIFKLRPDEQKRYLILKDEQAVLQAQLKLGNEILRTEKERAAAAHQYKIISEKVAAIDRKIQSGKQAIVAAEREARKNVAEHIPLSTILYAVSRKLRISTGESKELVKDMTRNYQLSRTEVLGLVSLAEKFGAEMR